jgi:hypothetical protein
LCVFRAAALVCLLACAPLWFTRPGLEAQVGAQPAGTQPAPLEAGQVAPPATPEPAPASARGGPDYLLIVVLILGVAGVALVGLGSVLKRLEP